MTKKEQAAMQSALDRADTLAALRWTEPVERDVLPPEDGRGGEAVGWDFNSCTYETWIGWTDRVSHGRVPANNPKRMSGSQGARAMFSSELLALKAMRHEIEMKAARELLGIDWRIAREIAAGKDVKP